MRRAASFALPLLLILALSAGSAFAVYSAVGRAMEDQASWYETVMEGALERALSSRDMEIRRLNARIDEQWREFYETLDARQPVLGKGKIEGR
jgi:hypothetical protein